MVVASAGHRRGARGTAVAGGQAQVIVVPVALATMVAALLLPAVDWLDRRGAPRGGAVALVILGGFAVFGGIMTFVVSQFVSGLPSLVEQVTRSIDSLRSWLIEGPAHLSREQIDNAGNTAIKALRDNQEKLTTGALSTAATLTEIITGAFLVLFTLIFLLHGGRNIYGFVTRIVPGRRPGTGARRRPGRVRLADRLRAGDVSGGAGGRRRHRHRPGDHGRAAGAAAGFAGVPRCFHPAGRCRDQRLLAVIVALLAKGFVYALITSG